MWIPNASYCLLKCLYLSRFCFLQLCCTILQTGIVSFLLKSFREGWTCTACMSILSPVSRLLTSSSIFEGMCSARHRYFKLGLNPVQVAPFLETRTDAFSFENKRHTNLQLWSLISPSKHQVQNLSCYFILMSLERKDCSRLEGGGWSRPGMFLERKHCRAKTLVL